MKRLSILLFLLIAIITAQAQTSSWNTNVTWTPSFRTNSGAIEVRFALGGTKPYYNLSDSLNMIRNAFSNYYTKTQADVLLATKQATLISGTNIKTINGNSLLGSGNITISGGGGGAVNTVFGRSGDVVALSADYDPFYPLLVGTYNNPTWINTLAYSKITGVPSFIVTENDPVWSGVSANYRTKTQNDGLYYPLSANPENYLTSVPAQSFSSLTGKPTTLGGYGITDAYPLTGNPSGFLTSSYSPPSQVDNDLSASTTRAPSKTAVNTALALKENSANKQNSLTADGTGVKFPTVDAVNTALATKGNGTVTNFSKTDGIGIISSVSNSTTTPNHTIAVDTTTIRTVSNSLTLAQLQTKLNAYLTTSSATATYVPLTRTLTGGIGIGTIGDLSANRTINVDTTVIRTVANSRTLAQTQTALNTKQNTLVSGTNIKTINGSTILGSGDLVVGGAVSSLTTTGSSGAATLTSGVLNIPTYVATDFYPLETEFEGAGTSADKFRLKAAGVTVAKGGTGVGTLTGLVKGNGTSAFSAAVAGTDYLTPTGSAAGLTSFPTLNQNTTGSAASLTTARNIWNVSFNGTANVTGKPVFTAGATGAASINIPHGVAPTSPVNGDFWTTTTGFFARINGVTQSFLPLAGGTLTGGLFGTTSEFSTYARVGASASTHIDMTSGDIKYYASNGTTLLSVYPLTLTANRVQRYQDKDGTIALTSDLVTPTLQQVLTAGNILTRATSGTTGTPIIEDIIRYGVDASSVSKIRGVNTLSSNFGTGLSFQTNNPATANTNVESMRIMYGTTTLGSMRPLYITNNVSAPSQINGIYYDTDNSGYSFGIGKSVSGTQTNHIVLTDDNNVSVTGNLTAANLVAGTYTPTGTITDGSGTVTSITPLTTHYSRVGNQVTVSGAVTFSTAASNTNVTIELTLPVSSNFGNGYDAFGSGDVASSLTNYSAHVIVTGNPTSDKAIITLNTLNGTFTAYYRYMYTIL